MTTTVAKWVVVGVVAVSVGLLAWTRQGRPPAPTSAGLALFSVEGVPASLRLYGGESVTVDLTVTSRTDMPLDIRVAEVSCGCTEAQLSVQRLARRGDRAVLSVKLDSSTIADALRSTVILEGRPLEESGTSGRVSIPLYAEVDRDFGFSNRGMVDGLVCDLSAKDPLKFNTTFRAKPGWRLAPPMVYSSVGGGVQLHDTRLAEDGLTHLTLRFNHDALEMSEADEVVGIVSVEVAEADQFRRAFRLIVRASLKGGYTVAPPSILLLPSDQEGHAWISSTAEDTRVVSIEQEGESPIDVTHDLSDDGRIHVILRRSEFTKPGSRQQGKIRFGLLSPSTQARRTVVLTWQAL